jgi:hypothetical protein
LSDYEKQLAARVQGTVTIEPGTVMLKVLRPGSLERYLRREISPGVWGQIPPFDYRLVGGVVARQQDCANLRRPSDYIRAFRLDYPGSPFAAIMPTLHTMEFLAVRPSQFITPLGAPSLPYPRIGYPPNYPEVYAAAVSMEHAAENAGLDPNSYRREVRPWPYTGTGLTAADDLAVPERWRRFSPVPANATIFECDAAGRKRPVAIFRGEPLGWEGLR